MAKCPKCGKKGLFVKLTEKGVCKDCIRLTEIEERVKVAGINLERINLILADKKALQDKYKQEALSEISSKLIENQSRLDKLKIEINSSIETLDKTNKQFETNSNKTLKLKNLYKSIEYSIDNFFNSYQGESSVKIPQLEQTVIDNLSPTVQLKLHCMDVKDLRKLFNQNKKDIQEILEKYKDRYTTKTNATIYKLIIIALEAELQNILFNINFGKLEDAVNDVKSTTAKYLVIATEGNQSIVTTLTKFIGQIEYLFIEAVKIEYEYFIQKEKIKEEQRAIREQMRQEAEERKELERQKKLIEKEEEKYKNEIDTLRLSLESATEEKSNILNQKIIEMEQLLAAVQDKKEEITELQNGKAGNVYVISNLGAFGNSVFKIGMTRRLEPQDRIDELGSASVPFPFDVHSFIFSEDAVGLENKIHKELNEKRLNKVNLRKEFFSISIEELESLVLKINPSANFNKTMLAEQYNQSLSINPEEIIFDEVAATMIL